MQFESGALIRMGVAEVEGLEGVGGVFSGSIRLWKCVEKSKVPSGHESRSGKLGSFNLWAIDKRQLSLYTLAL
jgi:hypothetical protein